MAEQKSSSQLEYLRRLLGEIRGEPVSDWESVVTVFNRGFFSHKPPKIAVTGMIQSGKATLLKALFGITFQPSQKEAYRNTIVLHKLASGVEIFDTPGIGGEEGGGENVTRLFLGLPPVGESKIEKIQVLEVEEEMQEISKTYPPEVARERLKDLDIILFILDAATGLTPEASAFLEDLSSAYPNTPIVVAVNKIDRLSGTEGKEKLEEIMGKLSGITKEVVPISAHDNQNISLLSARLVHLLPVASQQEFFERLTEENRKIARNQLLQSMIVSAAAKVATLRAAREEEPERLKEQQEVIEGVLLGLTEAICQAYGLTMQQAQERFGISETMIESEARKIDTDRPDAESAPTLFKEIREEGGGGNVELATAGGGFLGGAVAGAVAGSFVPIPVVGTMIGAIAGGVFGLGIGSQISESIGKWVGGKGEEQEQTYPAFTSAMLVYAYGQSLCRFLDEATGNEAQDKTQTFDIGKVFTEELRDAKSVFSNIRAELETETDYQVAVYLLKERIRQEQLILRSVYETAISDGTYSPEERAYLERLARQAKLTPDVFKYISRNELLEGIKKMAQDETMRTRLLEKVRGVALRDHEVRPEEWTFLAKIYETLGIHPDQHPRPKKKSTDLEEEKWRDQHERSPFSIG